MLTIKWDRERFYLDSPDPSTPLKHLRNLIAELTQLPPDGFKLIYSGAVMKDDNAPLSAYHIRQNASITIIVHTPLSGPQNQSTFTPIGQTSLHTTEQTVVNLIHAELAKVRRDLLPGVEAFMAQQRLPGFQNPPSIAPQGNHRQVQEKEHSRLGELLLQSLLRLDGITTEGEWEHARRERKAAVKEVQALLDRLDESWAEMQKMAL